MKKDEMILNCSEIATIESCIMANCSECPCKSDNGGCLKDEDEYCAVSESMKILEKLR